MLPLMSGYIGWRLYLRHEKFGYVDMLLVYRRTSTILITLAS